jgi:hypothetical protein
MYDLTEKSISASMPVGIEEVTNPSPLWQIDMPWKRYIEKR